MNKDQKTSVTHLLYVNSYRGSGIGDFGFDLAKHFDVWGPVNVEYLETKASWSNFAYNWLRIFLFHSLVIVNLGFTSYGKSASRNFLNFLFLGITTNILRRKVRVILHDSPELTTREASGYRFFTIMKIGAAVATRLLKRASVHVFSKTLYNILVSKYKFRRASFHPFPCMRQPVDSIISRFSNPLLLNIGYIAPYKGLEILADIKELNPDLECVVVGGFHPVLSKTSDGQQYMKVLTLKLKEASVKVVGFLSDEDLGGLITDHKCISILPYITTSGSSYAAIFSIEMGIPVIASNLEEFRVLQEYGAGIQIVNRTVLDMSHAIQELLGDEFRYEKVVASNVSYCRKYSALRLISDLLHIP
ncbi:MAG: hypothetical protein M0T81_02245 [Thermoplasmatales archaeon]|nr:hypothetical protein [Thermoplasmatales archaeon]